MANDKSERQRPSVLLTDNIHDEGRELLKAFADPIDLAGDSDDAIRAAVAGVDTVIVRRKLPDDIFDHGAKIKFVIRHGIGVDYIPVAAATKKGIPVANIPDANVNAVAELIVGQIISLARRLPAAEAALRNGVWESPARYAGHEVGAMTVAIIGLGGIGRRLAAILTNGFGCRLIGHSPSMPTDIPGLTPCSLEDAFREADFVITLTPLNEATRKFVNAGTLALMKPSAFLINASRGGVIDEAALADSLRGNKIAGAALDVFAEEPVLSDHPFFGLPNLILTPHLAGISVESFHQLSLRSVTAVKRVLIDGERPENVVNPEIYEETSS